MEAFNPAKRRGNYKTAYGGDHASLGAGIKAGVGGISAKPGGGFQGSQSFSGLSRRFLERVVSDGKFGHHDIVEKIKSPLTRKQERVEYNQSQKLGQERGGVKHANRKQ